MSLAATANCAMPTISMSATRIVVSRPTSRRSCVSEFTGRPVAANVCPTGRSPLHSNFFPRPISFSRQPHVVASTSASSTSASATSSSAMTSSATDPVPASDCAEEASVRQMSPEEHWWWGASKGRMGNWHGQWRTWKPFQSRDAIRSVKSVRKLWATSPDLSSYAHMNDWYDLEGEAPKQAPRVGVQWDLSLAEHSLPDGICHVANSNARRYVVSREGDGIWGPLDVADGAGGIKPPLMVEFFFSHTDTARLGSSVVFEPDGALAASVVVEESLDTNDRRPQDWVSPMWGPGVTSSQLPDHLPPVPALDDKTMLGTRTILTRNLMVQERENVSWAEEWSTNSAVAAATVSAAAAAAAAAAEPDPAGEAAAGSSNAGLSAVEVAAAAVGFMGRVPEGDEHLYAVFALPQGVVMCAPRSLPLVAGRQFVLSASWVVGAGEVKRITASWGADGGFAQVEGECYRRV